MDDLIRKEDALDCFHCWVDKHGDVYTPDDIPEYRAIEALPSVELELLTDAEKRIFLKALEREEKICEDVDKKYTIDGSEYSLVQACKEIRRKVKGALWT